MPSRAAAATWFFVTQALLVVAFWVWLWLHETAWQQFTVTGWPPTVLFAFAIPDLLVLGVGGIVTAVLRWRGAAAARAGGWLVAGASCYATGWTLAIAMATGEGSLACVAMVPHSAAALLAART